ncbi:hypothetical protein ABIF16_002795 [Bradyrhizobium elkanii]
MISAAPVPSCSSRIIRSSRLSALRATSPTSYVPMNITVSYAGQDGTAKPFLMIINWLRVGKDWKIASEIILPVPPVPAAKG